MSSSQTLGGNSRAGKILGPSLDKIIKNVAWRKHSALVASCKAALDRLEALSDPPVLFPDSALPSFSPEDADALLRPFYLAFDTSSPKIVEPALDCLHNLLSLSLIWSDDVDRLPDPPPQDAPPFSRIIDAACRCGGLGEEAVELALLRALLSAIRSPSVYFRGEVLVQIVKTCFNVYLGSDSTANQMCAKATLAQIMAIVYARVEEDSMEVAIWSVSVGDLVDSSYKSSNDSSMIQFVQNFIKEALEASEGIPIVPGFTESRRSSSVLNEIGEVDSNTERDSDGVSKIREDGYFLFKNICKFSMKFSTEEMTEDQMVLRGKVLSLELLNFIIDNAGPFWRTNEKFIGAIRQYLCLSLLKNSALSAMSIFQLLCSIFTSLLMRFRSELKAEIGIFFPMLVLRVLENVLQPSFVQKMTVLNLLERICEDSQLTIDIFVNYDCDVDSPNIFERIVNGLLKTALGAPSGSTTTLSPAQDVTFRLESVKCLVTIIKSMGAWMDQQLRIAEFSPSKNLEIDTPTESHIALNGEEVMAIDYELHSETNFEQSEAATLEQRRAYKIEFQKGISLFNRKPSKGIEFLINSKKIGGAPEEVALFLKNTSGLSETMIGDYLGEREEFPLKVMHAYVDAMNFEKMDFGEAIRFLLRGFRLPGEAQKIDRIMEKFAERYCKCNPSSFTSADTAYVLAYSVIMLNTDAHNSMVKDKMSKADFVRNNRGIDDGKDLPEEYLGSLYEQIVKNEIKMNADSLVIHSKQVNSINKLLGFDSILSLVTGKQAEEKALGANGLLIKHIQEQFRAKAGKSEPVFYAVTDVSILRFMVEACWAPMLAAFSMTLDQSDDRAAASQCLQGFRHAVHVTSVMSMQTQRDAFVTSVAKFTYLHCAADMKLKNVDAVKAIISIAIEDGNYLQEAWEHVLTCLSRFEHLQLLGEGAPPESSFFASTSSESEEKLQKTQIFPSFRKKGNTLQNPAVMAVVRGGSYDSTAQGVNTAGLVTPEQISNFITKVNLLDQIGNSELNHIFVHSQRLNGEAIVAFVKALCKVSMAELQSPTDPRVFSLTKIVEIAHYNMGRIRLVWTRMWKVLSDFFVSVGLSENLSVEIFVMDSLRQLAMKFLEREELANYNFQNEFLRPFVIVMQKSSSAEIRELIVRCVSQMVLSRVNNIKSGWKSVFMVFTTAAADERKSIVILAFETIEKIVRDYFPYITETEIATFTDCVKCLITFTNSRFNSDVSLNAIAFLRFCAVKLAEGGLLSSQNKEGDFSVRIDGDAPDGYSFIDKDDPLYFWAPLLTGLSKLTSDPRLAIRKSSLEVLFDILKDHGHVFSCNFWISVLKSFVFPIFGDATYTSDTLLLGSVENLSSHESPHGDENLLNSDTYALAAQYLVDLFVIFYDVMRLVLPNVVSVLTRLIRSPIQGSATTGVATLVRLADSLGDRFSDREWNEVFLPLKEASESAVSQFFKVVKIMDDIEIPDISQDNFDLELYEDQHFLHDFLEDDSLHTAKYVVARMKGHISVQLLILQVIADLYKAHRRSLSAGNARVVLEIFSMISWHAHHLNSAVALKWKLRKACSILEAGDPPMVHFENESYQSYLRFMQTLLQDDVSMLEDTDVKLQLVTTCEAVIQMYLTCAGCLAQLPLPDGARPHWKLPLGSSRKEELAARTSLVVSALEAFGSLEIDSLKRYLWRIFPSLVNLIRCEHTSGDVQCALSDLFQSTIGPIIMKL